MTLLVLVTDNTVQSPYSPKPLQASQKEFQGSKGMY